ncbi:hypothetical protein B0A48_09024 [Cryoendolithus antarcticus]|uniref:Uncharacterized protein n=1 Tax=Cryoendolithus antarcticus TaxID=1507870 RepID=A0A1V8T1H7_9PEZI|nr:hypothetical protein B0A48_09024 [Cryoendolithus antarcticus]
MAQWTPVSSGGRKGKQSALDLSRGEKTPPNKPEATPPDVAKVEDCRPGHATFIVRAPTEEEKRSYPWLVMKLAGTNVPAPAEIHEHAVIVGGRPPSAPLCQRLRCNQLWRKTLANRCPIDGDVWQSYVPIGKALHPYSVTDLRYRGLEFTTNDKSLKMSYVKAHQVCRVEMSLLRPHRASPSLLNGMRLTDASISDLLSACRQILKYEPGRSFEERAVAL